MMSATLNIVSKYDGRGVRSAKGDMKGLSKTALITKAGMVAALYAVSRFAKASAQAFIEDEKQMSRLDNLMRNFGMGSAVKQNEAFIASLEKSSAILDDELRPSMEKFLLATKDVTASQKLMQIAVDVSAGTGKDLDTVSIALSRALTGNRKGLLALNTGLDASTLKTGKLTTVFQYLGKFAGSNAKQLGTTAREIADAQVIWNNFQESIGQGVVTWASRGLIAVKGLLDGMTSAYDSLMGNTNKNDLSQLSTVFGIRLSKSRLGRPLSPSEQATKDKGQKKDLTFQKWLAKLDADAAKAAADKAKADKASLATKAKALALSKLAAKYDLELIGLAAAKRNNAGNAGMTGRLTDLQTIATANAGLPVSASALAGAKNTQINNFTTNVAGTVISAEELAAVVARSVAIMSERNGIRSGGWL